MRIGAGGRFAPCLRQVHVSARTVAYPYRRAEYLEPVVIRNKGGGTALASWSAVQSSHGGTGMNVDEEAVRQLAQLIWETEGRPEGQEARHWEMATRLAESAAMAPVRTSSRHRVDTLFPLPGSGSGPKKGA
jgi:hypothetical protein